MAAVKALVAKSIGGERETPQTQPVQRNDLTSHIEAVAYYKAEARGFETGHEIEDWLEAEREVLESSLGL